MSAMQDNGDKYDITIEYSNELTVEDILLNIMLTCCEDINDPAQYIFERKIYG